MLLGVFPNPDSLKIKRKRHLPALRVHFPTDECPLGHAMRLQLFQRMMSNLFNFLEDIIEVFMDDFLIYGSNFSDFCLNILEKVLKRYVKSNLVLN